jgi:hypothetical protein
MKIVISKNATKEEVVKSISRLESHSNKKGIRKNPTDFAGTLKGVFGDGLKYQKTIRKDWDGLSG